MLFLWYFCNLFDSIMRCNCRKAFIKMKGRNCEDVVKCLLKFNKTR